MSMQPSAGAGPVRVIPGGAVPDLNWGERHRLARESAGESDIVQKTLCYDCVARGSYEIPDMIVFISGTSFCARDARVRSTGGSNT